MIEGIAYSFIKYLTENQNEWDTVNPRWKKILDSNDNKLVWGAINWKGGVSSTDCSRPSDNGFKIHFEGLLNPNNVIPDDSKEISTEGTPYIPVLDDPITLNELERAVNKLNSNKRYKGVCPGLLRPLPSAWFVSLLSVINMVFFGVFYPLIWCYDWLVTIFKNGNHLD